MDTAIRSWNPWWTTGEVPLALRGRPRPIAEALRAELDLPQVLVVSGIRRSGKTTLLYQLIDGLLGAGTSAGDILFLNLEDPAFDGVPLDDLLAVQKGTGGRRYVFLDEVQHREGWERTLLPHYERKEPVKFIVSGSSAELAQGRHAHLLTGRSLEHTIPPLSFEESLRFARSSQPDQVMGGESAFHAYLEMGGFPEVYATPEVSRRRLLQQYFDQILARDIARDPSLDINKARRVGIYLAETFARPHTGRALAKATGIASLDTLHRYVTALERVFLVHTATRAMESPKPHAAAKSPVKFYWVDPGLRNALVRDPQRDRGRLAENVVANHLRMHHGPATYWRDDDGRSEVDFVVRRPEGRVDAYQVWYDLDGDRGELEAVPERESRGFEALRESLPRTRHGNLTLLTARTQGSHDGIRLVPIHQWLVGPQDA